MNTRENVLCFFWIILALLLMPLPGDVLWAEDTTRSLQDQKAQVFRVEGDVKILKSGQPDWAAAEKGMILEAGDQLLTGSASAIEIAYDDHFLNIARIDENTKAEFKSIEPTDLKLEDGSIFSALDGLKGSSYQVTTPVAVAAVRGTHFEVAYDAATQLIDVAVVPDTRAEVSQVELLPLEGGPAAPAPVTVPEGNQLDMAPGRPAEPVALDPARIETYQGMVTTLFQGVDPQLREQGMAMMMAAFGAAPPAIGSRGTEMPGMPRTEDDNDKALNPPSGPGGGNQGGGGSNDPRGPFAGPLSSTIGHPAGRPPMGAAGYDPARPGTVPGHPAGGAMYGGAPAAPATGPYGMPSQADAMADALIPSDPQAAMRYAAAHAAGGALPYGGRDSANGPRDPAAMTGPSGTPWSGPGTSTRDPAAPPATDMGQMYNFLMTGGAFTNPAAASAATGTRSPADFNVIFTNMGYAAPMASNLATGFNMVSSAYAGYDPSRTGNAPAMAAPTGDGTGMGYPAPYTAPGTAPAAPGTYSPGMTDPARMAAGGYVAPLTGTAAGTMAPAGGGYMPPAGDPMGGSMMAGGYMPPGGAMGGYMPPAGGGYYDPAMSGGYMPPGGMMGGYMPPAGGFFAPAADGTSGTYMPPGGAMGGYMPPAGGGYYDPAMSGGYMPAGGAMGGYMPPAGGYDPAMGGAYMPPTGGYYDPAMSGGGYMPPGGFYDPTMANPAGTFYDPASVTQAINQQITDATRTYIQDTTNSTNYYVPPPTIDWVQQFLANDRWFAISSLVNYRIDPNEPGTYLEAALSNSGYNFSEPTTPLLIYVVPNVPDVNLKINDIDYVDGTQVRVKYDVVAGNPQEPSHIVYPETVTNCHVEPDPADPEHSSRTVCV